VRLGKIIRKLRKFQVYSIALLFPGFTLGLYGFFRQDRLAFKAGMSLLAGYFLYTLLISETWRKRAWNLLGFVSALVALI